MLKETYTKDGVRVHSDEGLNIRRKGRNESWPAMTFKRDTFPGLDALEEIREK